MRNRPRRYCAAYPCARIAVPGSAYCQDHQPPPAVKQADDFYLSPPWRRFREWFVRRHPLCEMCEREGRTERTVIVDHIRELKDGGARYDEGNVQSLCRACHNKKTAQEMKKRGKIAYFYSK